MLSYGQRRKREVHKLLGGKCKHCGEKDPRVLQIDHVKSDGNRERRNGQTRGQLYRNIQKRPKRYQLLCANCNWRKRDKDFKVQRRFKQRFKYSFLLFLLGNLIGGTVLYYLVKYIVGD